MPEETKAERIKRVSDEEGLLCLSKVFDSPIKEVKMYVGGGQSGDPSFSLRSIELENGMEFWCEGEHDRAYITDGYSDGKFRCPDLDQIIESVDEDEEVEAADGFEKGGDDGN